MSVKKRAVWTAIFVALSLAAIKSAVGFLTMSMAVLSSALDSLMDVFSMSINLAAVHTAEKPADEAHQFGHGKAEAIAGLFQAIFIAASATFLIVQAFHRMIDGYRLNDEMVGVVVMCMAIIASVFLVRVLKRASSETESSAIEASALNFGADIWTNIGVLVALGLERFAAVKNADPIISILISLYIAISAIRIGHDSIAQLMDKTLPAEALAAIDSCINGKPLVCGYHRLRTRRVGGEKYIEFHLEVDSDTTFESAHAITEAIIADIQRKIPGAHVTVHSDPV
ncbi:MAG: cation diffusion facilitator family transporter [Pseudomonadota bacterium]